MNDRCFNLEKDFVVISPDKRAATEAFNKTLYQRIEENYDGFKGHELVSRHEFDEDWTSWEMHPNGDEVVMLLSGCATMVLETDAGEKTIEVNKVGDYIIVPKGIWHTARTKVKTTMLFITPGEGTQHK